MDESLNSKAYCRKIKCQRKARLFYAPAISPSPLSLIWYRELENTPKIWFMKFVRHYLLIYFPVTLILLFLLFPSSSDFLFQKNSLIFQFYLPVPSLFSTHIISKGLFLSFYCNCRKTLIIFFFSLDEIHFLNGEAFVLKRNVYMNGCVIKRSSWVDFSKIISEGGKNSEIAFIE